LTASPILHEHFAHSRRRGVFRYVAGVLGYPALAWHHRLLVQNFFWRELLGRFRGSFLGAFWVLLNPLFLFTVYFFIFGYVFKMRLAPGSGPDASFAVYMLSGLLVISAFMEGTSRACTSVFDNGNLVKKVAFPSQLLPVHLVGVATIVFLVGLLVLMVMGLATGTVRPDAQILLWPLVLVVQMAMTLGVGLGLACIYVFMRDASHIWTMVGQALTFLSPTFWVMGGANGLAAQAEWAHGLRWTPTYALMQAHRHSLGVTRDVLDGTLWQHLGVAAAWTVGFLALGYGLFASRREKFADLV
jgi:lipopolysaccharide transport system permease protein